MLALHKTPPQLLPQLSSVDDLPSGCLWRLVSGIKGGCEKALALDLLTAGIPYFLPMDEIRLIHGKGKYRQRRTAFRVLFPGYLFMAGDDCQIGRAFNSCWMGKLIRIADQGGIRRQLGNLYTAISLDAANRSLEVYPYLVIGREVEVTSGPFRGKTGILERRDGSTRFIVRMEWLGQSVAVVIDDPGKLQGV